MTKKQMQEIALKYVKTELRSTDILDMVRLREKLEALGVGFDEADEFALEVVNPIIHGHP